MAPRFRNPFQNKSNNEHKHTELMAKSDRDATSPKEMSPELDLLDTELFRYGYDLWFGKAMFQYSLARVIESEHWGHACINPGDVIKQVEATYSSNFNEDIGTNGKGFPAGHQLYERINHARAAKNAETFEFFLSELSNQIRRHCRVLRNEKLVELDAEEYHCHKPRQFAVTPSSSTGSCSSARDIQETPDLFEHRGRGTNGFATKADLSSEEHQEPTDTGISEHGSSVQSMPIHSRPGSVLSQPDTDQIPMYRYTSLLWEHGAISGKAPTYVKEWATQKSWRCIASFDGIKVECEAGKYKDAMHDASKRLCELVDISTF